MGDNYKFANFKSAIHLLDEDLKAVAQNYEKSGIVSPVLKNLSKENILRLIDLSPKLENEKLQKLQKLATEAKSVFKLNYQAYKIKKKDTLYSISRKFKVTIDQILELNKDITDRTLIYKSDIIAIPLSE